MILQIRQQNDRLHVKFHKKFLKIGCNTKAYNIGPFFLLQEKLLVTSLSGNIAQNRSL